MTDPQLTPQERTALDWHQRRQQADWRAEDEAAFQAWRKASPLHAVAYLRMERAAGRAEVAIARLSRQRTVPLAAPRQPPSAAVETKTPLRRRARRWLAAVAVLAVVMVGGSLAWVLPGWEPRGQFSTEVGSRRTVMLEDGSRVELNTNTRIRAFFEDGTRQVHLIRGEAYFDVQRDLQRPFIVHADGQRIVVLGTRFTVRREAQGLHVVVTEGKVRIDPLPRQLDSGPTPPVIATQGDSVRVDQRSALVTKLPATQLDSELAWRSGFLMFNDIPLNQVAAEFNRYNRRQLVVDDRLAAAIRISGSFEATNLDAFIRLLRQGYQLKVEVQGGRLAISA